MNNFEHVKRDYFLACIKFRQIYKNKLQHEPAKYV